MRPGTLLALGARDDRPDYDYAEGVSLHAYELADGETATAVVPTVDGAVAATFVARRAGDRITVTRQGAGGTWKVSVVGTDKVVSGGADASEVTISLI